MNIPKDWGQFQGPHWTCIACQLLDLESQNDWHGSGFRSQSSMFNISCSQTGRIQTSSSPESNFKRVGESLQELAHTYNTLELPSGQLNLYPTHQPL